MLTTHEKHEIDEAIRLVPVRKAAGIEALKIVQEHRRWVSDESLNDIATLHGYVGRRVGFRSYVL